MGKIFGISDLPVSTIMTAMEITRVPEPYVGEVTGPYPKAYKSDVFVSKTLPKKQTSTFLNIRKGIGKLMNHFSKNPFIYGRG